MNPTDVNSIPIPDEYLRALKEEWDELAAKHPTPTDDDIRPEWLWVRDHAADGSIDPEGKYWGLHVAVYQQRIVGAGREPIALQVRLARELNIHPERMVVTLLGDYGC
jgi:hypothetical protein